MVATYEPGTVAVATVRGVEGVRVMWTGNANTGKWVAERAVECESPIRVSSYWVDSAEITDVRPLAVLDPEGLDTARIARAVSEAVGRTVVVLDVDYNERSLGDLLKLLRENYFWSTADQIEAQAMPLPLRIPEPGKWGVVADVYGYYWTNRGTRWTRLNGGVSSAWEDIVLPTLIRDGVS